METAVSNTSVVRRRLLLRDSLTVLALCSVAAVLFGITSFLFTSFERHREDLAKTWSDRGKKDLEESQPAAAVYCLRAALTYAPGNGAYQLLLATALADAGRTDEAINYFLNMWAGSPGDGFVNLQLARLMRRKGYAQQSIEYYRSSIYGNWQGDGTVRRREIRLELAQYLIDQQNLPAARVELLIVAGNAPLDDPHLDVTLAEMLQSADDRPDAWIYFKKAIASDPKDLTALEKGGYVAYDLGEYGAAHSLFTRAVQQDGSASDSAAKRQELTAMEQKTRRLLELDLSGAMSRKEFAEHIALDSQIAEARMNSCSAQLAGTGGVPPVLQNLQSRWKALVPGTGRRKVSAPTSEDQDSVVELINDTESQTQQVCGPPTGDDALLVLLGSKPYAAQHSQQPSLEKP